MNLKRRTRNNGLYICDYGRCWKLNSEYPNHPIPPLLSFRCWRRSWNTRFTFANPSTRMITRTSPWPGMPSGRNSARRGVSAKSATAVKVILAKQPEEPLGHEADEWWQRERSHWQLWLRYWRSNRRSFLIEMWLNQQCWLLMLTVKLLVLNGVKLNVSEKRQQTADKIPIKSLFLEEQTSF